MASIFTFGTVGAFVGSVFSGLAEFERCSPAHVQYLAPMDLISTIKELDVSKTLAQVFSDNSCSSKRYLASVASGAATGAVAFSIALLALRGLKIVFCCGKAEKADKVRGSQQNKQHDEGAAATGKPNDEQVATKPGEGKKEQ